MAAAARRSWCIWMVTRAMKRYLSVVGLGLAGLTFILSGCETSDRYSAAIKYGLRRDPLVKTSQAGDLGDDVIEPDRPGTLPILAGKDVLLPNNPLNVKGESLFTKDILRDPALLPDADRQALEKSLTELFGTPAEPKVGEASDEAVKTLKLEPATLKEGSRLYRIHCLHCHGVPGDGRGPTARWINPHPRDFRSGLFKFMSVNQTKTGKVDRPPRREDLLRTVRHGIEGTAMPAFLLLDEQQLNDMVSYVIHLSMRGSTEFETITQEFDFTYENGKFSVKLKDVNPTVDEAVKFRAKRRAEDWLGSQSERALIPTPSYNERFNKKDEQNAEGGEWQIWKGKDDAEKWRIRGALAHLLFNEKAANRIDPKDLENAKKVLALRDEVPKDVQCAQCHEDYGRRAKFKFDQWATLVRPNNFTAGVFRGGRRPVDVYHRVHSGISGSNMNRFGDSLSSNSIWDMVEFVQALSYPAMRKKMGIVID